MVDAEPVRSRRAAQRTIAQIGPGLKRMNRQVGFAISADDFAGNLLPSWRLMVKRVGRQPYVIGANVEIIPALADDYPQPRARDPA